MLIMAIEAGMIIFVSMNAKQLCDRLGWINGDLRGHNKIKSLEYRYVMYYLVSLMVQVRYLGRSWRTFGEIRLGEFTLKKMVKKKSFTHFHKI